MAFSIKFIGDPIEAELIEPGERAKYAQISIGDFKERMLVPLGFWSTDDYLLQWKEALTLIVNGENRSGLIVSMQEPHHANFIGWWLLYREGSDVFIQNKLDFMDKSKVKFEQNDVYRRIPSRETVSDNGEIISEWHTKLQDISNFLSQIELSSASRQARARRQRA